MDASSVTFEGMRLLVPPEVYEPAEDSFLLARAAKTHAFGRVLDMGCGSGIVGLSALGNPAVSHVTFADKNLEALEAARNNLERLGHQGFERHDASVEFVQTDLFKELHDDVHRPDRFDVICFNPPYLPTDPAHVEGSETIEGPLNAAFDGGLSGRDVLDRFLSQFSSHLNAEGILLLLNSSRSGEYGKGHEETLEMLEKHGFIAKPLEGQAFFFEDLKVFKATRAIIKRG